MELFYSENIDNKICILDSQESIHCMKVLRHKNGDIIHVIDGKGNLLECVIDSFKKEVQCSIISIEEDYGSHPYKLTMAVSPTKNFDRYEWFLEKSCELGIDVIVPIIGEYSERKSVNYDRMRKILISAAKQSQKAYIPTISKEIKVLDFLKESNSAQSLKMIAYCGDVERDSLTDLISGYSKQTKQNNLIPEVMIMIGPEGDFSSEEVNLAIKSGFYPIYLGKSRLRTETAAIAAVSEVYFNI